MLHFTMEMSKMDERKNTNDHLALSQVLNQCDSKIVNIAKRCSLSSLVDLDIRVSDNRGNTQIYKVMGGSLKGSGWITIWQVQYVINCQDFLSLIY